MLSLALVVGPDPRCGTAARVRDFLKFYSVKFQEIQHGAIRAEELRRAARPLLDPKSGIWPLLVIIDEDDWVSAAWVSPSEREMYDALIQAGVVINVSGEGESSGHPLAKRGN